LRIASGEDGAEISPALNDLAADFVPRSALCVSAAVNMMERRLHAGQASLAVRSGAAISFGEVLGHELNNPREGILGNAELLLLEVRRGSRLELPAHDLQRLETITDLAGRLLNDRWEAVGESLSAEKEPPLEQRHQRAGG
jgi:signal transduction histidine kinase